MSEIAINKKSFARETWEFIRVVVEALLIALVIRTFIFGIVFIPTSSMVPTLLIGDYLYVTKYAYGYSKHSFPYSAAPFSGRLFASEPRLGDIVVFKGADDIEYIKRLVGLPGDEIQVIDGLLHINGKAVGVMQVADFTEITALGEAKIVQRGVETLPNGVKHYILNYGNTRADHTPIYKVPMGHYFMMGDSRDNSNDSRFQDVVKMVPFESLIGRADYLLYSMSGGGSIWAIWNWPKHLRTDRLFKSLDSLIN